MIPADFNQVVTGKSTNYNHKILTSATTLGIIGTLKVSTDFSRYDIEAKIIGLNL